MVKELNKFIQMVLAFSILGVLGLNCYSPSKLAKICNEKFPNTETTVITELRDTTIQRDTFIDFIDCTDAIDSFLTTNERLRFQYKEVRDSMLRFKPSSVIKTVRVPYTNTVIKYEQNTKIRFRDSALIVILKDSMFNQAGEIIKLETKVQDLQKEHGNQKQWKFYFLIAFLISLLVNVLQLWLSSLRKKKETVSTFKF